MSIYKSYKIYDGNDLTNMTPETVVDLFSEMDSHEQAKFFNHIAKTSSTWLTMQMQYITDDDELDLGGRRVMQYIGDYSHWGLVPQADLSFLEEIK